MTCANNCKGVNPNAVIIGGSAVLAASTVTLQQVLTISAVGVAAAGGGAAAVGQMMNRGCPRTRPCNVGFYFSVSTFSNPFFLRGPVEGTPVAEFAADSLGRPAAGLSVQGDVEKCERLEYRSVLAILALLCQPFICIYGVFTFISCHILRWLQNSHLFSKCHLVVILCLFLIIFSF